MGMRTTAQGSPPFVDQVALNGYCYTMGKTVIKYMAGGACIVYDTYETMCHILYVLYFCDQQSYV